ncbi:MAG TPA: DegT/DnrJ/EryC1/StrS family aminotransferase [Candidatus Rubrimentiphilum sp.]|nr:DegT/DnrJ/EryC1/StrS family aminotransferase [Candidatus Rubrimentiphilum sp.]
MTVRTSTRVPFSNLALQWDQIKDALMPDLERLFESSSFVLGPAVASFEKNFSAYVGARHTIGANSGTSALHLAMVTAGIGAGDKVLLPSHTFAATAWAVVYVGATPVLCDVEPRTGTIDVADAERRMSPSVKAIVPVHLYGQPADMRAVSAFAQKHGLIVIEDAAQAHGAEYGGKRVGANARFACFSFYPGKNLGAAGEGGAVCTSDDAIAERIRSLGNHGQRERYVHEEVGFNYRMEGIQGLILDHKLRRLDAWTAERKRIAKRYLEGLRELPLEVPETVNGDHVYHLFVIRTPQRDALREHLAANGIETGLHYPVPLHRQPCFANLAMDRDSFPVSDSYANQCLSLPIFAGMTGEQIDLVVENVRAFLS